MNAQDLLKLTNEAEVKAYLREVGKTYGRLGLLQVAEALQSLSSQLNERVLWILEVVRDMR